MRSDGNMVLDANESAFFARELEHIKTRTFDVEFPEIPYRRIFPISQEGGVGVTSITFRVFDKVGVAKLIGVYGGHIERVDVFGTEVTVPVRRGATSFGITLDEIEAGARTGRPISAQKSIAALEAIERLFNNIAFFGDAEAGLMGLFTHPNIPSGAAPLGGWLSGEADVTPETIAADVYDGLINVVESTKKVEVPNRLVLPIAEYNYIAHKRMSTQSGETILSYITSTSPYLKGEAAIMCIAECEDVAALHGAPVSPAKDVAIYYNYSASKLEFEIPEDVNFTTPQIRDLEEVTIVKAKTGGLNVYKPLSVYIQTLAYAGGES
jgi:hypothetical protein